MTLKEAYRQGESLLCKACVDNADLDAWHLLEHVTQIDKARYYLDTDRSITQSQEEEYLSLIMRRSEKIPLQHLTGVQKFMGLEFQVNEHVLIPRQDTEVLVEVALQAAEELLNQKETRDCAILDLCTGSGCVLLSFLYHMRNRENKWGKGNYRGVGADISPKAIEMARSNGSRLHIPADFLSSDVFEKIEGFYDIIVSNPPYIRTRDIHGLQEEVRRFDPVLALDGKEDGLFFYRKITACAHKYLLSGGYLIFEIGSSQGEEVKGIMERTGFSRVAVQKDLAGLDRVVIGVYDKTMSCEKG